MAVRATVDGKKNNWCFTVSQGVHAQIVSRKGPRGPICGYGRSALDLHAPPIVTCREAMLDHYQILGVPRGADFDEIKRAYRKKQVELHPDRNPNNPESEEKFKDVVSAYEVLSDPVKKQAYDCGFTRGRIFDPSNIDPTLLDPDRFVNTFVNLFGDYLDEHIPGGFRSRVKQYSEHVSKVKKKNSKKKSHYSCEKCKDTGRLKLKQGNFTILVRCYCHSKQKAG